MARGSGLRPWKRGTEAARSTATAVVPNGDLIVTDEGNVYAGDGTTQTSALRRLARLNETSDQTIPGHAYFTSPKGVRSDYLGVGAGIGSARMPVFVNSLLRGPWISNDLVAPGSDDYVLFQFTGTWNGGFASLKRSATGGMTSGSSTITLASGTINPDVKVGWYAFVPGAGPAIFKAKIVSIASDRASCVIATTATTTVSGAAITFSVAADPNFLFGMNRIYLGGNQAGDLDGIDFVYGDLAETYINTPNANLKAVRPMQIAGGLDGANAHVDDWAQVYVKTPEVRGAGATIGRAFNIYIDAKPVVGATEAYGVYLDGGGKTFLKGTAHVWAQNAADDVLTLQMPLNPTGKALAVFDVTKTQRVLSINPNGSLNSVSFLTAFEGNGGGQVTIGQQPGSFPGIAFGTASDARLSRTLAGVLRMNSGRAFGLPSGPTSGRPLPAEAPQCLYWDTTASKLAFSDGITWKELTIGAAI